MTLIDFFTNHTYRMVFLGTVVVGVVAGILGSFAYLRKQSLISDVISHSSLPGTLIAFLVMVAFNADGRNMLGLVIGAVVIGTVAVWCANAITQISIVRIDAAMATTMAFFFGMGTLLMRIIIKGSYPGKGGIQDYLFGNASTITTSDLKITSVIGAIAIAVMIICWPQFVLRTFDPDHCAVVGFKTKVIDALMFATIAIATVIGVKSVGLVLMVAFVVTPPASARQWTNSLPMMVVISGLLGGLGSALGAYFSIRLGKVPTGPLIVLTLFAIFVVSMLCAPQRSIVARYMKRRRARGVLIAQLQMSGKEIS